MKITTEQQYRSVAWGVQASLFLVVHDGNKQDNNKLVEAGGSCTRPSRLFLFFFGKEDNKRRVTLAGRYACAGKPLLFVLREGTAREGVELVQVGLKQIGLVLQKIRLLRPPQLLPQIA